LIKELQAAKKELKALSKRIDKLMAALQKADAKKPAKAKAPKKTVAKKVTAADTVFNAIARLKKGTDTAGLVKKTGFDQKKVANIIFKLKKQGKITSPKKGLYVKS